MSRFFCALPRARALGLARAVGWLWYWVIPLRRRVALRNVDRVFGAKLPPAEKQRIVRTSFAHLCMYAVECLRMPQLNAQNVGDMVDSSNMPLFDTLLTRGKGVIAVTAHVSNFDLLGTSQAVRGYPVHAVLKDIAWGPGRKFWAQVRHSTGLGQVAPRQSGYRIIKLLRRNQIVAFAIDQHMPAHRAIVCDFFGQLAATTPAPVRLAFATGAPIVPVVMVRTGDTGHHTIVLEPEFVLEQPYDNLEANVRHNTARLNRIVERWVLTWPEQWLWAHKRWKVQDRPNGWEVPPQLQHMLPDSAPESSPG